MINYLFIAYSADLSFIEQLPECGARCLDLELPVLITWPKDKSLDDGMLDLIEKHYSEKHPRFNFISGRLIAL